MRSLQLAVVQFTPVFREKEENFRRMRALTDGIDADVIVLPELCSSGYFFLTREEVAECAEPADGPTWEFFKDLADRKNAMVTAGFAERDGDRLFNSCFVIRPGDGETRVYRKTHLFYKERLCFDAGDTGFFVVEDV
ncbi:MAG: carbon-nitrogen hydrolase, partial [Desulfobacterales bacterium]|nr:carbon-nitrogen hydrolase [Desulfobacterales bacterium]